MITRRNMLAGLAGLTVPALSGCAGRRQQTSPPMNGTVRTQPVVTPTGGLDAVIDISHLSLVTDFTLMGRHSNILGIIHKASEGGDWVDPVYTERRGQAEAAGMLWGAYHFGSRQYSGADQAQAFLAVAQPGPGTLMALDFEPNDRHPANTMTIGQADEFVRTIYQATGRLPLVYTHPTWANGGVYGHKGLSLGESVSPDSILARCELWLVDYREEPEVPWAWARRGWRLWQYAGNYTDDDAAYGSASRALVGVDRCDRNLFAGDASALYRFWGGRAATA
jgi:lysozyme